MKTIPKGTGLCTTTNVILAHAHCIVSEDGDTNFPLVSWVTGSHLLLIGFPW